jgi:hypothetical protein
MIVESRINRAIEIAPKRVAARDPKQEKVRIRNAQSAVAAFYLEKAEGIWSVMSRSVPTHERAISKREDTVLS